MWYPSKEQPDSREWLVTNGLGGYSMGTVSGVQRRRYHAALVAALAPPLHRRVVLSKIEETLHINGVEHSLATSSWTSGVVSPTGFRRLECFTILPTPTWVYEINGHYLIKRQAMPFGKNELCLGYTFLPDPDGEMPDVKLTTRILVGFRNFHAAVKGSSDDRYPQFVSPNQTMIILNENGSRLCLTWNEGEYEVQKQWWWDYAWPDEAARGEVDHEDLFLVGSLSSRLSAGEELSIGASFEHAIQSPDCHNLVEKILGRQNALIHKASLPRTAKTDLLILASDQFVVPDYFSYDRRNADSGEMAAKLSVIEGYPWFNDSGRAALQALPGLTLTTRRFDQARSILRTFAERRNGGLVANRSQDAKTGNLAPPELEFTSADVSLWFAWALFRYFKATQDKDFVRQMLPHLVDTFRCYSDATIPGIYLDNFDGLLDCGLPSEEFSWMDAKIAEIPITPRAGKAVELNALWYSFLETLLFLSKETEFEFVEKEEVKTVVKNCKTAMERFWNAEKSCLYDVIEARTPTGVRNKGFDDTLRPNQLMAVSMPFRALTTAQEKAIVLAVENELLIPMGVRTLSAEDPQYQSAYGCGFQHADQYHRDLSYHQGTAWTWLLGTYAEAIINIYGATPETVARVKLILQPLLSHLTEEACLGSISELFDGSRPHLPRGTIASACAVAECMRWQGWQLRQ
jgi:predicted glycogen debranching enzyme